MIAYGNKLHNVIDKYITFETMTSKTTKNTSSGLTTISKMISNFFNPLTSLFIYFAYSSSQEFTFSESAMLFLPLLMIVVIPVSAWIYWNVRKGNYTNMDVSNRKQRKSLYFFIALSLLVFIGYDYYFNENVDLIVTFLLILLVLLQLSNYYIKSSMHTAFNFFVAALFFALNPLLGAAWLIIAILVGVTRIILKRHTVSEVISGASIAILVSFIYLYTHIQGHL